VLSVILVIVLFGQEDSDNSLGPLDTGSSEDQQKGNYWDSFGLLSSGPNVAVTDPITSSPLVDHLPYRRNTTFNKGFIHSILIYNPISHIIMLDVFRSLKTLLKTSRVQIDNNVFRLHYSITVILLLAFCVIITTKQYVGDPIDCIRSEAVPQSVINTYCWYVFIQIINLHFFLSTYFSVVSFGILSY